MSVVIKYLYNLKYYYREDTVGHEYVHVPQRREGVPYLSPELIDEFLATYPLPHWRKEPTVGPHPEGHANLVGPLAEKPLMHGLLVEFIASKAVEHREALSPDHLDLQPQPLSLNTTAP